MPSECMRNNNDNNIKKGSKQRPYGWLKIQLKICIKSAVRSLVKPRDTHVLIPERQTQRERRSTAIIRQNINAAKRWAKILTLIFIDMRWNVVQIIINKNGACSSQPKDNHIRCACVNISCAIFVLVFRRIVTTVSRHCGRNKSNLSLNLLKVSDVKILANNGPAHNYLSVERVV